LVKVLPPLKSKTSGHGSGKPSCPVHPIIESRLAEGDRRMDTMCKDTAATKRLVIAIAKHIKVPLDAIGDELKEMMD
jgi:hypothetical protein